MIIFVGVQNNYEEPRRVQVRRGGKWRWEEKIVVVALSLDVDEVACVCFHRGMWWWSVDVRTIYKQ